MDSIQGMDSSLIHTKKLGLGLFLRGDGYNPREGRETKERSK
jgi:hypothetical protein